MNMNDILVRAAKTAIQAATAVPITVTLTSADIDFLQAAALSGVSAGIAFLWNAALEWSRS